MAHNLERSQNLILRHTRLIRQQILIISSQTRIRVSSLDRALNKNLLRLQSTV